MGASDGRVLPTRSQVVSVEVDGRAYEIRLQATEPPWTELARRRRARGTGLGEGAGGAVDSPMQGTVLAVEVAEGEHVEAGQVLVVVEAMKMENEIPSPRAGVVQGLAVAPGAAVALGQRLCEIVDGDA